MAILTIGLKKLYSCSTQSKAWHTDFKTKKTERKTKKIQEAAAKIAFSAGSTTSADSTCHIKTEPHAGQEGREAAVQLFN